MLEKTLSELGAALGDVACSTPAAFERFAQQIPADLVLQALAETGTASLRKRRLPAEQVVMLLIGMALLRDQSITAVADKLEIARPGKGVIAASSLAEARARLGASPLEWLFVTCSEQWATRSALASAWRGLSVYGVDGTTPPRAEAYGDASYGTAEIVEKLKAAGIETNVKVQAPSAPEGCFSKDEFSVDLDNDTVTCPAGKLVVIRRADEVGGFATFGNTCATCPLHDRCTDAKRGRTIRIHPREATLKRMRQQQSSPT